MKLNQNGIDFIKNFEGCVLHAYKTVQSEEYYTIGYGHYGSDVHEGDVISLDEAEKLLASDLMVYEQEVNAWNYHYKWNINEYTAMVSFAYNCGVGGFRNLIKNGSRTKDEIAEKILLYNTDGNNTIPGLVTRREEERKLFLTPTDESYNDDTSKKYVYVDDIVKAIWDGEFGTPWSESPKLYEYFQKLVNEYRR